MSLLCDPTNARRLPVSGLGGVKLATDVLKGDTHRPPDGNHTTGETTTGPIQGKISLRANHRIATWNIRGTLKPGKLSIVEREMVNHHISILGICETHIRGNGHFKTASGNTLYFSGADESSHHGVGILIPSELNKYVLGYKPVSDRIISIRINTKPCILNVVQIYAPTLQSPEQDINNFYGTLESVLDKIPNREITMIIGDWNAKIGDTTLDDHIRDIVGKYGLGVRNERGSRLIEFCISRKLTILNTCFKQHPRRLYTWKSPGDRYRNQIDFIIVNTRWRSSITNVKTFPGAECGSDHNLLLAKFTMKMKAPQKNFPPKLRSLKPQEERAFRNLLENKLENIPVHGNLDANTQWEYLKHSISKALDTIKQSRKTEGKKSMWISDDTWNLIELRKIIKAQGVKEEYSKICQDIQRKCRQDKNNFIKSICSDIERHSQKFQTADLFKKVRLLSKKFKPKTWVLEDANGQIITDLTEIASRWREYCEHLYASSNPTVQSDLIPTFPEGMEREPPILRSEVETALSVLKKNKAPGPDQITAEVLRSLGDLASNALYNIVNNIWQTGVWPKDWTESVILPLHKKGSTKRCDNYRTLALISHASKVLLHILNNRIRNYLDWQIPQEQAGFVKGKGTREQILNVRQLVEKAYEHNTPVIMCFVDYSKAFDCVNWNWLWKVLTEFGVPKHLVYLIKGLYLNNQGKVRVDSVTSDNFHFEQGVRQGCILSPILFNVYGEYIMRRTCEGWKGGVSIGGVKITNLRYADDTTLLAANESEMVALLNRMEAISKDMGLSINRSKTKLMVVDRAQKLHFSGTLKLESVDNFVYLGSIITNNGSSELEIRRRIAMAKTAMSQLQNIWRDRNISRHTKIKLVRTLVFSIFLYACETWTIKAADRTRIDAFEMWCWRRMLGVSWVEHRTNLSILKEIGVTIRLSTICLRRVLEFFGHIARKTGDNLEKLMVTGSVEGGRGRGRSPTRWSDQIRKTLAIQFHDAVEAARDRDSWKATISDILIRGGGHDPQ